jgi:hypothetical protein
LSGKVSLGVRGEKRLNTTDLEDTKALMGPVIMMIMIGILMTFYSKLIGAYDKIN